MQNLSSLSPSGRCINWDDIISKQIECSSGLLWRDERAEERRSIIIFPLHLTLSLSVSISESCLEDLLLLRP